MKRLALLLGSLLVVSAAASAKEVVPAPVVVEEAPVQIVEKEVIVYRDKEEGFRPNGFVDLQYRYYGDTEGKGHSDEWNKNNNYSRITLEGKIQMTEKQALDFRTRNYNSLDYKDDLDGTKTAGSKGNRLESRLRYYYNHGTLGETNVGMTSFVKYEKAGNDRQDLEYQYRFDLTDYFFNNDFIKTTNFLIGPSYKYSWGSSNGDEYTNSIGLYMIWDNQLPWGFSTEVELDGLHYNMYGDGDRIVDGKATNLADDSIDANVNLYLYHDANLYTNGAYSVDWHFEGGFDSYTWYNRDTYGYGPDLTPSYDDTNYEAYAQPSLIFNYQATEFVNLYAQVGAEYRNWAVTAAAEASHWRWQPFAIVGFRTTF